MPEKASNYLESITAPLTTKGVEILAEDEGDGKVFVVIPRDDTEYGALIGVDGAHADAIRTLMRAWSGVHTDGGLRINVLIPNPRRIRTTYI